MLWSWYVKLEPDRKKREKLIISLVNTPLGIGPTNVDRAGTNQGTACRLNTAVFAVAIIGA